MLAKILANGTTPIVLISGISILLLVSTNRMTHVVDKIRQLFPQMDENASIHVQIGMLMKKARVLRIAIVALCGSILSSSILLICAAFEALGVGSYHHIIGTVFLIISTLGIVSAALALLVDAVYSIHSILHHIEHRNG